MPVYLQAAAKAVAFGNCMSPDAKVELDSYVDAQVTTDNTPECDVAPRVTITGAPTAVEPLSGEPTAAELLANASAATAPTPG